MGRRKFSVQAYDVINLTPLIDTLFFLLIIFMVTAPLLEYTVDVSPPEMNADPLPQDEKHSKIVSFKRDGSVRFENSDMSKEQFLYRLGDLKHDPEAKIFLRADRAIPYGDVIDLLNRVRKSGFTGIYLITGEETEP